MRRMWSGRTIATAAAVAALAAACATPSIRYGALDSRVGAALERRGVGPDGLRVIDNLLEHGGPAPPATPRLVRELLAQPLEAADAERIFRESVPPALAATGKSPDREPFDTLLQAYIAELAEAQRLLRAGTRPFDDEALARELAAGLPSSAQLLAVGEARIGQASALFVESTVRFASRIGEFPDQPRSFESAIGTVVIGTRGNDRYGPGAALIVDPGGDDVYERAPARAGAVSVIVDLGGNDRYSGSDVALRALSAIVDHAGDDRYAMESGLGAAIAGVSLVLDFAGDDEYASKHFAQGAAAHGFGALVDLGGADRYRVEAWGQGFGMAGGTGLLWDRGGNDRYSAGGIADSFERGAGLSGAQGASFGARGRLGGGVGILRDDQGDDLYEAQMFAQGSGYYYGLGLLWDRGGADRYHAHRYAQGNAAHQAVGVLRDEAGDDRYTADWYAQGMGLDVAAGLLVDAAGSDSFTARGVSQGTATANGFGLLAATNGRFSIETDTTAWGEAEWLRGLPSVGVVLHDAASRFMRIGEEVPAPRPDVPVAVQRPSALGCPSSHAGESLVCRVVEATDLERTWRELTALMPKSELAGWIAVALAKRPPSPPQAAHIAEALSKRESCNVRALALRAWPTPTAAHEGVRSGCYRLQAAALAAFARLGERPPADASLPSFLRALPPQDDTF
jgi:hypothetical protein